MTAKSCSAKRIHPSHNPHFTKVIIMKKICIAPRLPAFIVIAMSCVMFATSAMAGTSDIKAANNQVAIQIVSTNVDYTETGNGRLGTTVGKLDTETGGVPGYALSLSVMKDVWLGNDYFAAEYDHASGNTSYTGMPITGGVFGSLAGSSGATLDNYRVRYGKGFTLDHEFMLTPYAELGNHQWERNVNYGEHYAHDYYGAGVLGQYSPVSRLVFSADALFGKTAGSSITVNGGGGQNGFSGDLGNSTLYKIGIAADYAFAENLHGNVGVDYVTFNYGISAIYPLGGGFVGWQPDSTTHYTLVKLGIGYAF